MHVLRENQIPEFAERDGSVSVLRHACGKAAFILRRIPVSFTMRL
jgi:hypothetical protein